MLVCLAGKERERERQCCSHCCLRMHISVVGFAHSLTLTLTNERENVVIHVFSYMYVAVMKNDNYMLNAAKVLLSTKWYAVCLRQNGACHV